MVTNRTPGSTDENDSVFFLTEWKTVHESKRITSLEKAYDAPLQVAAYAAAYNFTRPSETPQVRRLSPSIHQTILYNFKVRRGLLTYAYADGYPADVLILDEDALEYYFQTWCSRVEAYYQSLRSSGQ